MIRRFFRDGGWLVPLALVIWIPIMAVVLGWPGIVVALLLAVSITTLVCVLLWEAT